MSARTVEVVASCELEEKTAEEEEGARLDEDVEDPGEEDEDAELEIEELEDDDGGDELEENDDPVLLLDGEPVVDELEDVVDLDLTI